MKILKIGGSKINTNSDVINLVNILKNLKNNHFIIISAFGKTTSILNKSLELAKIKDNSYKQFLNHIFHFHLSLFNIDNIEIFRDNENYKQFHSKLINIITDIELKLNAIFTLGNFTNKTKDKILSYGEVIALEVLKFVLSQNELNNFNYINAIDFITTDDNFGNAEINYELTKDKLLNLIDIQSSNHQYLYITQGFIGLSTNGNITTMGYESSNLTAVVIANIFESKSITLISDTYGILNSDPRYFDNNLTIKNINYKDAEILSILGVKLLHKKMIDFSISKNITLYYKSLNNYSIDLNNDINNVFNIELETKIDSYKPKLISSVYLCDVKYKKYNLNGFNKNDFLNNIKLEFGDFIFSNSFYTNKDLISDNFIPLTKISIYNFKLGNFEKFYSKYSFIIDNYFADITLNTLFIFFDKIKMKEFCDENLYYNNFEKDLFSNIKLYL